MTGLFMALHAIISILLIVVILMQSGRGGGLTEGFASAESIFGAKTNEFMIKTTTVVATLFFVTCLGLAILSSQKGKSLMASKVASEIPQVPLDQTAGEDAESIMGDAVEQLEDTIIGGEEELQEAPTEAPLDVLPDASDDVIPDAQ